MKIVTRNGLHHFPIDADFAWQMIHSYSGGVNEWEIAALLTSPLIVNSLGTKVNAELDTQRGRNLSLWLTDEECMALAGAGQNCQTHHLPDNQQWLIAYWHEMWLISTYVREKLEA